MNRECAAIGPATKKIYKYTVFILFGSDFVFRFSRTRSMLQIR